MKIVTVAQMVQIEQASDAAGHSYDAMMEMAGRAVAAAILRHLGSWDTTGSVLVLVGPGNNGGDGLVAARYLHQWDREHPVAVYCWKRTAGDDENYAAVQRLRIPVVHAEEDTDFAQLADLVLEADVVVDALLGTGVSRPIGGSLADLMAALRAAIAERTGQETQAGDEAEPTQEMSARTTALAVRPVADYDFLRLPPLAEASMPQIVAVDCPSGLNCDTGALDPSALPADLTITFANPKIGHFIASGPGACGRLEIADIGTDPGLADDIAITLATPDLVKRLLPVRPADAHKGTFGKAMVVAGSVNYTGAAILACSAAYRAGAGLVTAGVVPSIHPIVAASSAETTWLLLPERLGVVSPEAARPVLEGLEGYAALLLGPGLTQEDDAARFVRNLLRVGETRRGNIGFPGRPSPRPAKGDRTGHQTKDDDSHIGPLFGMAARPKGETIAADAVPHIPLVLDADALNALAQTDHWHDSLPANTVLTPHPGEMARLCGCTTAEVRADRISLARRKAVQWNAVILLKGAYTVVAAPDDYATVLPFANPALATAGSGDVLAGVIVGLLSQGLSAYDAAVAGGYLHGLAGELARNDLGDAGVVAGDLVARLPVAIRQLRAA